MLMVSLMSRDTFYDMSMLANVAIREICDSLARRKDDLYWQDDWQRAWGYALAKQAFVDATYRNYELKQVGQFPVNPKRLNRPLPK